MERVGASDDKQAGRCRSYILWFMITGFFGKTPDNVLPFVTSVISAASAVIFTTEVYNKKRKQP